jgi:glycerate-2-kinase
MRKGKNEGLALAAKIIEARLPLYADIGQINALRECISSIKGAAEKEK